MSGRSELLSIIVPVYNEVATSRAVGSIVAIQDADLELDPQRLAVLIGPILAGETDVVYGLRFLRGRGGAPVVTFVANRVLLGERLR